MKKDYIKKLFNLLFSFCKIGLFTIGGGLAMMPMMQKELIDKHKWMTEEDLLTYYAIGQSTPGIVAVNVATFVGYKQLGILGGIFATIGIILPSLIIITILASLINTIEDIPLVQKALKGINVAVACLLTKVAFNFSKKTVVNIFSFFIMIFSFICVFIFNIPSFYIIIFAILIGIIIHFVKLKGGKING